MIAFGIYMLAALHTGLIAYHIPAELGRPEEPLHRVVGSILLGLCWPVSLLFHLKDIR